MHLQVFIKVRLVFRYIATFFFFALVFILHLLYVM